MSEPEPTTPDTKPRFMLGRDLGQRICEAFDLDPNRVSDLVVHCHMNEVAYVTIDYLPDIEQGDAFVESMRMLLAVRDERGTDDGL